MSTEFGTESDSSGADTGSPGDAASLDRSGVASFGVTEAGSLDVSGA